MKTAKLHRLLHQYFNNTISRSDYIELLDDLNKISPDEIVNVIDEELLNLDEGPKFLEKQSQDVLNRIKADPRFTIITDAPEIDQPRLIKFYQRSWLRIAAAILVFCTAGLFIIRHKNTTQNTSNKNIADQRSNIIIPGGQKATLTLANGKVILLRNVANGLLANTGASKVLKKRNGQIIYDTNGNATVADNQVSYNTLTTPKGGEYQVVLPDGTKVWLNAASSISYPVVFTGNERRVKLTGEAYFEVAKNKHKPFYVSINDVQIRVLGTHFNIAAYGDDEAVTTTLLEGSVQVTKNKSLSLLKPGQQAVINYASNNIVVSEANIENAMAWKNGYFIFNDDNIAGIMKKVSRWYDVDIDYKGTFADQKFGGTFYRKKSITELLKHLEKVGGIHFTITGRRITVMN